MFTGILKKKLLKPSEVEKDSKEYYYVGDVPRHGVAVCDTGYFISRDAFYDFINNNNKCADKLKNDLDNLQIEYDLLKRKYDKLLDRLDSTI